MARAEPHHREAFRYFRSLQTRWSDNDIYGHMNNVVHYSLFDTAINGSLIDLGLLDLEKGSVVGLVVETGCTYFAELRFPDTVVAGIRTGHVGTSSVRYEIGLFSEGSDLAAAQGHFVHVYVDRQTRRPAPIPDKWREALKQLQTSA